MNDHFRKREILFSFLTIPSSSTKRISIYSSNTVLSFWKFNRKSDIMRNLFDLLISCFGPLSTLPTKHIMRKKNGFTNLLKYLINIIVDKVVNWSEIQ